MFPVFALLTLSFNALAMLSEEEEPYSSPLIPSETTDPEQVCSICLQQRLALEHARCPECQNYLPCDACHAEWVKKKILLHMATHRARPANGHYSCVFCRHQEPASPVQKKSSKSYRGRAEAREAPPRHEQDCLSYLARCLLPCCFR